MELIFVMHGQAEHTGKVPANYEMDSPGLTRFGLRQAKRLRQALPVTEKDAVIASPTLRTLQTAQVWCEGTDALRFVHPLVSPRQYPPRYDFRSYRCDQPLEPQQIAERFSQFMLAPDVPDYVWLQGIDTVPEFLFGKWSAGFISWCERLEKHKIYIVSHEGTISSYLLQMTGMPWNRKASADESDWIRLSV